MSWGIYLFNLSFVCSVALLYLTHCNTMNGSTPGFPVLHYLPKLAQTHVTELVMPSNHLILCHLLLLLPSIFHSIRVFTTSGGQSTGASASASVLPVNIQGCFPLGLTGLISLLSKGISRAFSSTKDRKHQFFGTQPSYGPTSISAANILPH